jgi:hypothetical protein
LASKDGWVNIMYNGLDAVAVDQQVGMTWGHSRCRWWGGTWKSPLVLGLPESTWFDLGLRVICGGQG